VQAAVDHKSAVVAHVAHPPATLKRGRSPYNPLLSAFIKEYSQKDCHIRPEGLSLVPLIASTFVLSDDTAHLDARFEGFDQGSESTLFAWHI